MTTEFGELDAAALESMFGDESRYNIGPDREIEDGDEDAEYESVFPDGNPAVFCTGFARYVRRMLGDRAALIGYFAEENPQSFIAVDAGGHDFAIVDGRYLVDFWAKDMGYIQSVVIDLEDTAMASEVDRLYGPRHTWTANEDLERSVDGELPEWRAKYMEGVDLMPRTPGLVP